MSTRLNFVLLAVLSVTFAGCLVHSYGDARLQRNSDALAITSDRLYLKQVPLDRSGTHVRQARNLPLPIYPTHLEIPITPTESELKGNAPWSGAKIRIEFRTPPPASQAFFSNEVNLAGAQPGRSPGTRHQLDVPFRAPQRESWRVDESLPKHTDYDVVVTVLEPSKNKIHQATLYVDTYVH